MAGLLIALTFANVWGWRALKRDEEMIDLI